MVKKLSLSKENTRKKVLIGAQSWAYGPAGKASAIAHSMRKNNVVTEFIGTTTSYLLCEKSGHFNKLYKCNSFTDYEKLDKQRYSAVISVMDPFLAIWAYKNNLPVYYADSMSWFWIWNNIEKIQKLLPKIRENDLSFGFSILEKLKPDHRQLIAHLISKRIYSQGKPQTIKQTSHKAINAGSLIDVSYQKKCLRDTVLISLSGGISPATNLKSAVNYANLVMDLLVDKIKEWPLAKRFVITGHPNVIANIKNPAPYIKLKALSHPQFLSELNRSLVVFVPCGFTTVYESLAYNAPVVLLPENHNGHAYEYLVISQHAKDRERVFPHFLFTLETAFLDNINPIEKSMKLIDRHTVKYFKDKIYRSFFKKRLEDCVKLFENRTDILKKQQDAVRRLLPRFNGAEYFAKDIIARMK